MRILDAKIGVDPAESRICALRFAGIPVTCGTARILGSKSVSRLNTSRSKVGTFVASQLATNSVRHSDELYSELVVSSTNVFRSQTLNGPFSDVWIASVLGATRRDIRSRVESSRVEFRNVRSRRGEASSVMSSGLKVTG